MYLSACCSPCVRHWLVGKMCSVCTRWLSSLSLVQVATAVLSVVAKANTKRKLKAGASKTAEHSEEVREGRGGGVMSVGGVRVWEV